MAEEVVLMKGNEAIAHAAIRCAIAACTPASYQRCSLQRP